MASVFGNLVQRCLLRMSHVTGTSVQVYGEQIVAEMMQHRFDQIFEARFWEDYWYWTSATLTAEGVVDVNLQDPLGADIDRYTDIARIYYNSDTQPLPRAYRDANPEQWENQSRPRLHEPYGLTGKLFRVLPYGELGTVRISYRKRPDPFSAQSEVLLDDQLLILGTAYDYLEDDGTNPGGIQKMLNMYNARYDAVMSSVNEQPIPLNMGYAPNQEPWGIGVAR